MRGREYLAAIRVREMFSLSRRYFPAEIPIYWRTIPGPAKKADKAVKDAVAVIEERPPSNGIPASIRNEHRERLMAD